MKTLLHPEDKRELIAWLQSVHPTSPRRWGKMSVHQMVCHLADGFRMYMSLKPVLPVPVPYPRILLKWAALWAPMPWPQGFKTAPELDQQAEGTQPSRLTPICTNCKTSCIVSHASRDFQWQPHPHFGRMSEGEWMRLAYLHVDHHLRQFGA